MTSRKPDFIGVGYQKAGTSWVFKQLDEHPEIHLPPVKELRYFMRPWRIPRASWRNRLFSDHWHYVAYRKLLEQKLREWSRSPLSFKNDIWYRRFLLGSENDSWYSALFDPKGVSGEFTPSYVLMDEAQVADLATRFPETKVIIMLRDPVERTWSQMKMNLGKHKGRSLDEISSSELMAGMEEIISITPDYIPTIQLWQKYFPQVFIGFQEAISNDPESFLTRLHDFLGVSHREGGAEVAKRKNVGIAGDMPAEVREKLREYYLPQKSTLEAFFGEETVADWIT